MSPLPLAALLEPTSPIFAILVLGGLALGVYAQAARFPRLLAFAIAMVMLGTLLIILTAGSADTFDSY